MPWERLADSAAELLRDRVMCCWGRLIPNPEHCNENPNGYARRPRLSCRGLLGVGGLG